MKTPSWRRLAPLALCAFSLPALAAQAWVSLGGPGGSVTRYRPVGGAPAASYATPPGAVDMLLTPDGSTLLVATTSRAQNDIQPGAPSVLARLDPTDGSELARVPLPASAVKLVVDATGRTVYATGLDAADTAVVMSIDLQTGATAMAPVPGAAAASLYTIGISADGATLFVPTRDQLVFIDAASLAATTTMPLAGNGVVAPPRATPDGRTLLMAGAARVYAIDLPTRTLRAQMPITTSAAAFGSALSPDGSTFYVSAGTLSALDTTTLALRGSVALGQNNPFRLGLSPDGSRLFSTDLTFATTTVIDAATLTPGAVLRHLAPPYAVAVRADGSALFLGENANAMVQVDTATMSAGAHFAVGGAPAQAVLAAGRLFVPETANVAMQRTPAAPGPAQPLAVDMIAATSAAALGGTVYVNEGSEVRAIDAARGQVARRSLLLRVPASGGIGSALSIAPAGDGVNLLASYVALNFSGTPAGGGLLRVDPASGRQRAIPSYPFLPSLVAADRSGAKAYATGLLNTGTLGQWDLANARFLRTVAPAGSPQYTGLAVDATGALLLAADANGKLDLLDTATMTLAGTLPAGVRPSGVAVSADGRDALVSDGGSNRVTVIDLLQRQVRGTIDVGAPSRAVMFAD